MAADHIDQRHSFWLRKVAERVSDRVAWAEARLAGLILVAILCILLANVASRAFGKPLIWTDELAVYLLAMGAFAGASHGIYNRHHIAVTLLIDAVGPRAQYWLSVAVDLVLLLLILCLSVMVWRWFDPIAVLQAEDVRAYQRVSFNFMYSEPTTTLGLRKVWFWTILPLFCLTSLIHVLAGFGQNRRPS